MYQSLDLPFMRCAVTKHLSYSMHVGAIPHKQGEATNNNHPAVDSKIAAVAVDQQGAAIFTAIIQHELNADGETLLKKLLKFMTAMPRYGSCP